MRRIATPTTLAVVALLVAPAAAASWSAFGSIEPDNAYDVPTLMWSDEPGASKNRIYFNAYPTWGVPLANGGVINPNVAALETAIDAPGPMYWEAIFGVWVDCNGDGYVGMAETAVREYRNEALLDKTLCPPVTGGITKWPEGVHNYNGWVTELIPIGNKLTTQADKRIYRDDEAMVWGDVGRPDEPSSASSCNIYPARGQTQSTGGLLSYADCQGNRGAVTAFNAVVRDGRVLFDPNETQDGDEIGIPAGLAPHLGFDDPARPQDDADNPLNQPTFGDAGSEHSAVYLQDCDATPLVVTPNLPGDDLDNKPLVRPVPSNPVNPNVQDWTIPGTLNATNEGSVRDDCNYGNDRGEDFYGLVEGDFQGTSGNGKIKSNWNFNFSTASRGTLPAGPVFGGAAGGSTDFGIELIDYPCTASGCMQSGWGADSYSVGYTPPTVDTRLNLDPDDPQVGAEPAGAAYFSFYAYFGQQTTARGFTGPGGTGVYGSAQCNGFTSGIHNGWNCDKDKWYILPSGEPQPEPRPLARPGQVYNLRDVDCFDGGNNLGVGLLPASYGSAPCS